MKLKRYLIPIFMIVILFILSSCSESNPGLYINPEIYEYTPAMSSTPGIGLIASFQRDLKNKNYKFHWLTEQGTFLTWHEDGKGRIEILGNDVKTNVHKVYWATGGERIKESSFKVYLKVENIDTEEVIYETSIEILQNESGYFSIKE